MDHCDEEGQQAERAEGVTVSAMVVAVCVRLLLRAFVAGARGSIQLATRLDGLLAEAYPTPLDLVPVAGLDAPLDEPIAPLPHHLTMEAQVAALGQQIANVAIVRPNPRRAANVPAGNPFPAAPAVPIDDPLPAIPAAPAAGAPDELADNPAAIAPDAQDPPAYGVPNAGVDVHWQNDMHLGTRYYAVIVGREVGVFSDW